VTIENKTRTGHPVRPGRRPRLRLGALIGIALYIASRLLAPAEEADLARRFGPEWDAYCRRVKVPWL
jgi:protein-S-isoprenylcysteine O-methyltransferase Ste14